MFRTIINIVEKAAEGVVHQMPSYTFPDYIELEKFIGNCTDINTNVLGFLNCKSFIKTVNAKTNEENINFIDSINIPSTKKVIIMSATADKRMYELMFGDRLEFINIGQTQPLGKIIQYPERSYSRYQLKRNPELIKLAEEITNGRAAITYKVLKNQLPNVVATFGATQGIDTLNGMDLAIIGTPHVHPTVYMLMADALGLIIKPEDYRLMSYQKVQYNGFEFRFETFSQNEDLQHIQFYLIQSELEQAIGRARLLRNNCEVLVLSNFPIPGASFCYLSKEQEENLLIHHAA